VTSQPSEQTTGAARYRPLLIFLAALAVTAGPWFSFILLRFNRVNELGLIPGLAASLGEPQITEGLVGLLAGQAIRPAAATYSLWEWFSLLYRSFWFEYGWMQIFAAWWVYALFTLFLLVALIGLIRYSIHNSASRPTFLTSAVAWLLMLHLALFVIVVLARYILSATIDTGQGRHLYPALPVIALLLAFGLENLRLWKPSLSLYFSLLLAVCFLIPALVSLQPSIFILPRYHTLPITITPPRKLPVTHRQQIQFADGLSLTGFDAPNFLASGEALPVTIYWQAEKEADRDYLISLCLQDSQERPVACWRGNLADGRYPVRAWEAGDTVVDAIYIPIPTCYRIFDQTYTLHLEVWPLALDSPTSIVENSPVLAHTFTLPEITIRATDPAGNSPQTIDWWRAGQRLTGPTQLELRESIAQITYGNQTGTLAPVLETREQSQIWLPLPSFDTDLYLPCQDGPVPIATLTHFVADPTLPGGDYRSTGEETGLILSFAPRSRLLTSIQSNLTFARLLAPLSLQLPDQSSVDLTQPAPIKSPVPYLLHSTSNSLPVTIGWQTHRWMADPLVISLKLLDKDFVVGGERIATLGDRYPNVLWVPTEVVEETYPVQLKPEARPGLYRLELSLIRQDETLPDGFEYLPLTDGQTTWGHNLYPLTIRLLDPTHNSLPPYPLSAQLGEAIELIGYDLNSQSKTQNLKSKIDLALYWQSTAKIPLDYTVFTQLIGPDGQVWAQWDNPPQAGRYPTTAWAKNDRVVDRYTLTLRDGAPPGEYRLLVGLYDPATGQRLPVTIDHQPQPDNALELTRLTLNP
jgi:hypothetical protein